MPSFHVFTKNIIRIDHMNRHKSKAKIKIIMIYDKNIIASRSYNSDINNLLTANQESTSILNQVGIRKLEKYFFQVLELQAKW